MSTRTQLVAVIVLSLACAELVAYGTMDKTVSPASVLEIWGDVVRDSDQFGLKLTRLSAKEETALGDRIFDANPWLESYADPQLLAYVRSVGKIIAGYAERKNIIYRFHIARTSEPNAFALPGGHVIVTTGMLAELHSEAELAMVLGHEIAHVDLRHCVERYQYSVRLGSAGLKPIGMVVDLARIPLTISYTKYQEAEADAEGLAMTAQAGYDPRSAAEFMVRFAAKFGPAQRPVQKASTPMEEAAAVSLQTIGGYFRAHPFFPERIQRAQRLAHRLAKQMAGHTAYIGVENYSQRLPRSEREFSAESVTL